MPDRRLVRFLERIGADGLMSADPGVVRMLTGHVYDIESGPPVFALPAIVVAAGDLRPMLVCSADEAAASDDVITYVGYTTGTIDRVGRAGRALVEAIERSAGAAARWAVDGGSVPVGVLSSLTGWRAVDDAVASLTAVKTATDVSAIETAIAGCDAGQAAARNAIRHDEVDVELDLWHAVRRAMEVRLGGRIPVLADVASGPRAADGGGPPTARTIGSGDLVLVDLVPCVAGVWGDSCATVARGTPTSEQRAAHAAACEALAVGMQMMRPGTRSADIDAAVRGVLTQHGWGDYPHHTGHGVGFSGHEEPRIIPRGPTVLEAGMVVALEPGVYADDWGLRVEQVCVITDAGHRVLSGHSLALEA